MEFFLEAGLKGLNKWLRFFGYKTQVCENKIDKEIILKHKDKIFLITSPSTAKLLEKAGIKYLLLPRESLKAQLTILVHKLNLNTELKLNLCSICGEELISVKKEDFKEFIPPKVYQFYNEFNYCPKCKKLYWEGDHIKRLKERLKNLIKD
uniref:Mut7-C RNAse domain-containing protein n=1 Tax=Thermodesulfobacterium geofontis TaxID=1295609 RepID=A0A7C4JS49_9BACT